MVKTNSSINMTRVLRSVWLNQGITRIEMARKLGLNKSTISKIITDLQEMGIVEAIAVGSAGPSGGRRPIHLQINPEWGCVMGIEIQTEAFTVVGLNLHGDIFFSHTEPLDLRQTPLIQAFTGIVSRFKPFLEKTGLPLIGIGAGIPGFVDPVRGILHQSMPFAMYEPTEFVKEAHRTLPFDIPIMVENDANCGCWGELAFKHSGRPDNFMFVLGELRKHTINMDDFRIMALGLGLFLDGKVHHGRQFSAGEFRSITYQSGQVNQFSVSDEEAKRFLQSDQVTEQIADELARHISFLINILNLQKVVIGGPFEVIYDRLTARIRASLKDNWAYPNPVDCQFTNARMGERTVAYGAAGMFLEHLITVPQPASETERAPCGTDLLHYVSSR